MRYGGLMGGTIGNHYAGPSGAAMGALMAGQAIGDAFRNMGRSVADRRDRDDRLQQQAQQDAFRQQQFDMMQQRYDAEQQQRERQNAIQDNTLKARGLLNSGLLSGDIGPYGRTPEEMRAKYGGFNPLPYLTQEDLHYRTPEQKMQDALELYKQKLKAENEARPPVPKANLQKVEMDGPKGPGIYIVDMDTGAASFLGGSAGPSSSEPSYLPLDSNARKNLADWQEMVADANRVEAAFNSIMGARVNPETGEMAYNEQPSSPLSGGTGFVLGALPASVAARVDPEGVDLRGAISNFASQIMNALSGAAVSEQEKVRLESFLPTASDSWGTLRSKMKGYKDYLRAKGAAWGATYGKHDVLTRGMDSLNAVPRTGKKNLPPLPDGAVLVGGQ